MIRPSEPVVTLTLKARSTSEAPRIIVSSRSTTAPRLQGLAYMEADIAWCAGLRRNEATAARSKHCTSSSVRNRPASSRSTISPVMPPAAKLPRTPRAAIACFRNPATASDTPPAPVWNENPSTSRPEAAMTSTALAAILSPSGSVVGRVVPEAIRATSPIESTATTKSTRSWPMAIGQAGCGTRWSVTATTRSAQAASTMG